MKARFIAVTIVLILFSGLSAQNINLISESLPSLGEAVDFCQYGDYGLFVGGNHHLAIIDFNDPYGMPAAVFDIPDNYAKSYDVLCYGSYVYLFVYHSIYIVSLQDIYHPVLMATLNLSDYYSESQIQGSYLYAISSGGSLTSYSLNNPLAPTALDTLEPELSTISYTVAGDGFIACQSDSLYIVDTSEPYNLKRSATLAYSDSYPEYQNSQIAALGEYLICNSLNQLQVYSLSNPAMPSLVSSTALPCSDLMYRAHIHDNILWSLYLDGTGENADVGLMAIDLSNLLNPEISLKQSLGWNGEDAYYLYKYMRASGNRMVFSNYPYPIKTATLYRNSFTESEIRIPRYGCGMIAANSAWIVGLNPVINILDYQADSSLYPIQQIAPETDNIEVMQLKDSLLLCAYLFMSNEVTGNTYAPGLDIYNLQTGSKLSSYPLPVVDEFPTEPMDILICENNAILSNGLGGLLGVDISDPANPSQRFRIWEPYTSVNSTAVHGNELWVGTYEYWPGSGEGSLCCYDIADINNPVFKYELSLGYVSPSKMITIGDYLYVICWSVLKCFHLGSEGILEQSDYYLQNVGARFLLPLGAGLLVGGIKDMMVLSLKDPLHPKETGSQALEMVYPEYPPDPSYYPNAYYAVQGYNILVSNGYSLKCYDATTAAVMCEANLDSETTSLQIFPNPSRDKVYIGFNATAKGTATLELYNLRGQKVISRKLSFVNEGLNVQNLSLNDNSGRKLAAGIYIVKVQNGSSKQSSKLVVLH